MDKFEWDEGKNSKNQAKHGIRFEEILTVFDYPMLTKVDDRFDYGEVRYIGIGKNKIAVFFTIVYTKREPKIRIISARKANKKERKLYDNYYRE